MNNMQVLFYEQEFWRVAWWVMCARGMCYPAFFFSGRIRHMCVWIKTGLVKPQMGMSHNWWDPNLQNWGNLWETIRGRGYLNDFECIWDIPKRVTMHLYIRIARSELQWPTPTSEAHVQGWPVMGSISSRHILRGSQGYGRAAHPSKSVH